MLLSYLHNTNNHQYQILLVDSLATEPSPNKVHPSGAELVPADQLSNEPFLRRLAG